MELSLEIGALIAAGVGYLISLGAFFNRIKQQETAMVALTAKVDRVDKDIVDTRLETAHQYATKADITEVKGAISELRTEIKDIPREVVKLLNAVKD